MIVEQCPGCSGLQYKAVNTVADIISNTDTSIIQIGVADPLRGGTFDLYSGADAADDGMIFEDSVSNKWKRQTDCNDTKINVQWYGARADHGTTDNLPLFEAAIDYINSHDIFDTLYIPRDSAAGIAYNLSDTLNITKDIRLLGDGMIGEPQTTLYFYPDTLGLSLTFSLGNNGIFPNMENLVIKSDTSTEVDKHGIFTNSPISLRNVHVFGFGGNGIHISACAITPSGDNNNYGTADGALIYHVLVQECLNGIFLEGCDANVIHFNCTFTNLNKRWGIYDNGMLGNLYTQPHFSLNGAPGSVVTYGGLYYAALPGHDGYFTDSGTNLNKQPDLNLGTYWQLVPAMSNSGAWNSPVTYYSGGPLCIRNVNSFSSIVGSYTESFQPPIHLNARSFVMGGDNGAGVKGGAFWNTVFGQQYLNNADLIMPNTPEFTRHVAIGTDTLDYSAVLTIYQDSAISGAFYGTSIEGTYNQVYSKWKNNSGKAAVIGYALSDLRIYVEDNILVTTQNSTGLHPGDNGTLDLGGSSLKWKKLFLSDAIGVGASTPHASSVADFASTSKGVLLPRMTKTQRDAISSPATGLMIFQTDNTPGLRCYNGSNWMKFTETVD